MKLSLALLVSLATGCASVDGQLREPSGSVVAAFHQVRAGEGSDARAEGYRFRRQGTSVEATRTIARTSDDDAYAILDDSLRSMVRQAIDADPRLATSQITARVADRRVFLSGTVDSDATAVRALYDTLRLLGVRAVDSTLTPTPPRALSAK